MTDAATTCFTQKEANLDDFVHVFLSVIQSQGCKTVCGVNPGVPVPSIKPEYSTISQNQPMLSSSIFWCTFDRKIDQFIICFTSAIIILENISSKIDFFC